MTHFSHLPVLVGGFLLLWNFLLFPWMIWLSGTARQLQFPYRKALLRPPLIAAFLLYNAMIASWVYTDEWILLPDKLREYLPVWMVITVLILVSMHCAVLQFQLRRRRQKRITPFSVKEAMDGLPVGLAFCEPDGLPRLANARMNVLSYTLSGRLLDNGKAFWDRLCSGGYGPVQKLPDGARILSLRNGSTYAFHRRDLSLFGGKLFELTAHDITREYMLNIELAQKNAAAREMNSRLRALSRRITEVTVQKEILESKIRVHDSWAAALLRARQYLTGENAVSRDEVLAAWEKNASQLGMLDVSGSLQEQYDDILENAGVLGLKVVTNGKLPMDSERMPVLMQAMTACLSNIAKHTDGTTLYVDIAQSPHSVLVSYSNDGSLPEDEVRETGGLANLRRSVEQTGGVMTIESRPKFILRIELPYRGE